MAGVDFKVIFSSEGGEASGSSGSAPGPGSSFPPSESPSGPHKPNESAGGGGPKSTPNELSKGARQIAELSGIGPLLSSVDKWSAAFSNIYKGATAAAASPLARPSIPSFGPPPSPATSPAAAGPLVTATTTASRAASGAGQGGTGAAGAGPLAAAAGPAAVAVAAFAAAVIGGVYAVKKLGEALLSEGDRLKGFSGELTAAFAISNLRSELADIRRARNIGPSVARLENARSQINDKLTDLQTVFYKLAADFLVKFEPALPVITGGIERIADTTERGAAAVEIGVNALADHIPYFRVVATAVLAGLRKWEDEKNKNPFDAHDPFTEAFLRNFAPGGGAEALAARDRIGRKAAPPAAVPVNGGFPFVPGPAPPAGFGV